LNIAIIQPRIVNVLDYLPGHVAVKCNPPFGSKAVFPGNDLNLYARCEVAAS